MTVKLSSAEVEIIDRMTWGQQEAIRAAMLSTLKVSAGKKEVDLGAEGITAAKYKTLEVCVIKVSENGAEHLFSREWMDNLSIEDGDTLYAAVDAIANPEKKS